jgi:hypothetical protein
MPTLACARACVAGAVQPAGGSALPGCLRAGPGKRYANTRTVAKGTRSPVLSCAALQDAQACVPFACSHCLRAPWARPPPYIGVLSHPFHCWQRLFTMTQGLFTHHKHAELRAKVLSYTYPYRNAKRHATSVLVGTIAAAATPAPVRGARFTAPATPQWRSRPSVLSTAHTAIV